VIRQIITADNPIIRRKLKKISKFDQEAVGWAQDLIDTMVFANGAGLAANQIGLDAQLFVVGIGPKPQIFINPKLKVLSSKKESFEEGCLSVPGYRGPVTRPTGVEITFSDLTGRRHKISAHGYLARVLQHEMDHLEGRLYIDHIKDRALIQKVSPVKIAFFGSGEFAVPILISLVGLNWTFDFQTVVVVTQPPRPAGRERRLTPTPVWESSQHFNLPLLTPHELDKKLLDELRHFKIDLIVLADYGKILPKDLLSLPKYGALNLHPSLLPKYRGATPIQQAILTGEEKTGVTLFKMNENIDAGDVLGQYAIEIASDDTYTTLNQKLSQLGSILLRDLLPAYVSGELKPQPVAKKPYTAPKIPKDLGLIESTDTPLEIVRKVRALNPWPGVYTIWKGKRIKILAAHLEKEIIKIDQIQPEGGKAMTWEEFKRGYNGFNLPNGAGS
jgi:methionyl-tRNA formyltransferase